MEEVASLDAAGLERLLSALEKEYAAYKAQGLKLDMSRGKPAAAQLDLVNGALDALGDYHCSTGQDVRNYGMLEGIPEARQLFADLLGIPFERILVCGNSSLNIMYDTIMRFYVFGAMGSTPWGRLDKVKFLCPSPGYDRHFAICQDLGIEMIPVRMTENGPDMDQVEKLAASDDAIKGIWCVPLYSNPQGICYSDETVDRLAKMHCAAKDFRIFWDNAYGVHHVFKEHKLKDVFKACDAAGNPDRVCYFFSTSKITFPGAGVSMVAASEAAIADIKKHLTVETIGYDKINQLRTVRFLKSADGVREHMKKLAGKLRPKFEVVLNTLDRELSGTGLLAWTRPDGGYFVAVDTLPGCAKATVALAKEAGVVMTGAGATYPYKNDPADTNIRIAPTYPTVEELQKAMDLFCVCVKLAGVRKLLAGKK